ncbi:hypothetical protein [Gryllotalpicola protaetiae]|uniref:Uncharacterized protein n=1 Tax=Gryllotalpicola protaetiae TaxID=2419771 RepID=A0A387BU81_9MICO|nr:hypothetical protein [Gryllotalpicola protaetiae]AYG04569.1 hypothetical protein D7I44_14190 [Gryllotalpicola protaetiae]
MYYAGPGIIVAVLFWIVLALVVAGGVVFSVLAVKGGRWAAIAAGAFLVVAVVMVGLPHPQGPAVLGAVIALGAVAISAFGGSPAVRTVLALATRQVEGTAGGILIEPRDATAPGQTREVLRGGLTIGILERIGTTVSLLAGVPEAIAVIIAIKGVGRFSELGASEAQERFIIGTLVSLGWAALCGALAHLVW